jgi:hypothetical protein
VSIFFKKQPDGRYEQSGDLPLGTRTVMLFINGNKPGCAIPRQAKDYLREIKELLDKSYQFCHAEYELRPLDIESPELIAQKTAILARARKAHKLKEEDDE